MNVRRLIESVNSHANEIAGLATGAAANLAAIGRVVKLCEADLKHIKDVVRGNPRQTVGAALSLCAEVDRANNHRRPALLRDLSVELYGLGRELENLRDRAEMGG